MAIRAIDPPPATAVTLDDKYTATEGAIYLNGVQALVRLLIAQRRFDAAQGYSTAGFVSGYRGSPLGGLDFALWQARDHLKSAAVRFEPGVNEDLAATAIWGSQQTDIFGKARVDGVFGMWYGKNPGLDRTGDAFKHANMAGTSRLGGVLAVCGDDPAASSSSIPNQCEQAFISAMMPVIYPAGIGEIIHMGLMGYALSRYSGLWIGMKTVADTLETSGSIPISGEMPALLLPNDFAMPRGGPWARWPDDRVAQDARLQMVKLPAAQAFAQANSLDRMAIAPQHARFGIAAAGKTYLDVRQALDNLGIDEAVAGEIGLRVYKVGMVWPLEPSGATRFAQDLEEVLVIEERRSVIESQLKDLSYNWRAGIRPRIVGKTDENGAPLIPSTGETSPKALALIIGRRLMALGGHPAIAKAMTRLEAMDSPRPSATPSATAARVPYFCAGCPHARSTRLPAGSRAMAGIGCHSLAMWVPGSETLTICHMGGEGGSWIGLAPFIEDEHIFQNMGDGTYYHSGSLAIRAAIAAKARITYKILVNGAVAMTGGQPVEGGVGVPEIAWQCHGEGVDRIFVVADEPSRYGSGQDLPPGATVHSRDKLDAVMEECRECPGVSILIYDQLCATEKRRLRKRGGIQANATQVFINETVCEGCGDCSALSRCLAVEVKETPLGPKRMINQSTCNTDLSCLDGYCPGFVTVRGGGPRTATFSTLHQPDRRRLPEPAMPTFDQTYEILVAGVGGTGLITIGAILGMAAHIEGKRCTVLDNTGLARKGGAVSTHVRIANGGNPLHAPRISRDQADLLIGGDLMVAASPDQLALLKPNGGRAAVNAHTMPTSAHALNPEAPYNIELLRRTLAETLGNERLDTIDASTLATRLLGDSIHANMILLGMAYQRGTVPLAADAIEQAIALNGVATASNLAAFAWGRLAVHDPLALPLAADQKYGAADDSPEDLTERFAAFLTDYQNAAYASRYRALIGRVAAAEADVAGQPGDLTSAAARGYFKLLAGKDEFEVARLLSAPEFLDRLKQSFDGPVRLQFHLVPPFMRAPAPGARARKRRFGMWLVPVLRLLAAARGLRGGSFDPFRHQAGRKRERALLSAYEKTLEEIIAGLSAANLSQATELAALPETIRGFGHIRERAMAAAESSEADLLAAFRSNHRAAAE